MVSSRRWSAMPYEIINPNAPSEILEENRNLKPLLETPLKEQLHETSDAYAGVIAQLCHRHRAIVCKDEIQWILQQRKNGGAERPWRGVGYFRTRYALVRFGATQCGRIDPAALAILAALPDVIGGAA